MAAILEPRDFYQGNTYVETLYITDSNGDPIDFSGGTGGSGSGSGEFGSGSGEEVGSGDLYEALFQIREAPADSNAPVLLELTDTQGISLGNGVITIIANFEQTRQAIEATSARRLWAELDLFNVTTDKIETYRWQLRVEREYARPEEEE